MTPARRSLLWLANQRGTCSYRPNQVKAVAWLLDSGLVSEAPGVRFISITDAGRAAYCEEFKCRPTVPAEEWSARLRNVGYRK